MRMTRSPRPDGGAVGGRDFSPRVCSAIFASRCVGFLPRQTYTKTLPASTAPSLPVVAGRAKMLREGDAMTEAEWLAAKHPAYMLAGLGPRPSQRKRRLYVCAACRRIWHLIPDGRSRAAVRVAEQFAEGLAEGIELGASRAEAKAVLQERKSQGAGEWASRACYCAAMKKSGDAMKVWLPVLYAAQKQLPAVRPEEPGGWGRVARRRSAVDTELSSLAALLRDVFGPLAFRRIAADPAWLAWKDSTVAKLAQAAYDNRSLPSGRLDPASLAVLADALEEAGCTNADVLGHLRGPGPHVRGCWAVDLLLGKE